jgi:hypothetical protein
LIPPTDIADLRTAFRANPADLGVGLFNRTSGEIRLGSFDLITGGQGHQGLADALGITNNQDWRGFVETSDGRFIPTSHFNLIDGGLTMRPDHEAAVRQQLQLGGLLT